MSTQKNKKIDFEKSLETLEQLVLKMETGQNTLEEALADFEKGVQLIRHCQLALQQAEQKISQLTQDDTLEPFSHDD